MSGFRPLSHIMLCPIILLVAIAALQAETSSPAADSFEIVKEDFDASRNPDTSRSVVDSTYLCPKSSYFFEFGYARFISAYPAVYYFQNPDDTLHPYTSFLVDSSIRNLSGFDLKIGHMFGKRFFLNITYAHLYSGNGHDTSLFRSNDTTLRINYTENIIVNKYGTGIGIFIKSPEELLGLRIINDFGMMTFQDVTDGDSEFRTSLFSEQSAFSDTISYKAFYYEPCAEILVRIYHQLYASVQISYLFSIFKKGALNRQKITGDVTVNSSMDVDLSPPINAGGSFLKFTLGYSLGTFQGF